MPRVVIDSNIIISGLLWGGLPAKVFEAARDDLFTALLTEPLLSETVRVLARDKFAALIAARNIQLTAFREQYRAAAELVDAADIPYNAVRDPKDMMVLACAVGGQADFIVSGDKDLLILNSFRAIPILTAAQLLERLTDI